MNSCIKYFVVTGFFLIGLAYSALAAEKDYLLVSVRVTGNNFKINSISQRTDEESNTKVYANGDYELDLVSEGRVVSKNFFSVPDLVPMEVISAAPGNEDALSYSESQVDYQDLFILIPLNSDIDADKGLIKILRDDQVLLNQSLTEVPFKVISAVNARVITPSPVESFPPFPEEDIPKNRNWVWIGIIVLALLIPITILIIKKIRGVSTIPPGNSPPPLP